jgi:hypothetical protein
MPASHDPTRKQFFAKLFGAAAVAGAAASGLGKVASMSGSVPPAATGAAPKIRPDPRAVARREGSI